MISLNLQTLTRSIALLALVKGSFSLAIPDDAEPSITVTPDPPSNSTDDGSSGSTDPFVDPSTAPPPPTESIFSYDWSSIPKDFVDEVLEYFIALQVENSTSVNPGPQKRATLPKHGCDHINEWIRREYKPDISVQAYEDECKPAGSNDYQAPGHCPPRTYCTEVETVEANQIVIDTRCVPHKQPKKDNWNGVAQYEYRHVHAYYEETKFQDVPIVLNQAISGASVSAHVESSLKEWAIKTDATLTGNNVAITKT
ncbi:hypothetical protein Alg130_08868 [Pyrenophora tritici-repentis]|nr:hypothetical protein Alg130_08868 [Pyrenophora tritici-repentis]